MDNELRPDGEKHGWEDIQGPKSRQTDGTLRSSLCRTQNEETKEWQGPGTQFYSPISLSRVSGILLGRALIEVIYIAWLYDNDKSKPIQHSYAMSRL